MKVIETSAQWQSREMICSHDEDNCLKLCCSQLPEFYESLLKNCEKKLLPENLAINLIRVISNDYFSSVGALKNLLNSGAFFFELYRLFSQFSEFLITPNDLNEFVNIAEKSDVPRLLAIASVYRKYLETLKENDFLTVHTAPAFLLNTVEKFGSNLLIEAPEGLTPSQKLLFEKLFDEITVFVCNNQNENYITPKACVYEDSTKETKAISKIILSGIEKGAKYSDYAVFISDERLKNKLIQMFKSFDIPVSYGADSDNFKNFKNALIRYFSIFSVFERLGLENLSKEEFEKLNFTSRAFVETAYDELNTYVENMLNEFVPASKDIFTSLLGESGSLLSVVNGNLDLINDDDKEIIKNELENLRKYYGAYKNNKILPMVVSVSENYNPGSFRESLNIILVKMKEISGFYQLILNAAPPLDILMGIVYDSHQKESNQQGKKDCVLLASCSSTLQYKHVFVPGLTSDAVGRRNNAVNFVSPQSNLKISRALNEKFPGVGPLIQFEETYYENEKNLFLEVLSCAKESLILSTHLFEGKKLCVPSPYFEEVLKSKNVSLETPETEEVEGSATTLAIPSTHQTKAEPVIAESETLKLSSSAVNSYLKCPKKYYYKSLLNLKEQSAFAAKYGNIVHAIFEVVNKMGKEYYNKNVFLTLKNSLFNSCTDTERALDDGFKQLDIDLINASDKLSLKEMENNFEEAIEDIERKGFFCDPPDAAETEKSFRFEIDGLDKVLFDGRIDAILEKNGKYTVVDYKTGVNKENDLEYALSDNGVNFRTKTGKAPSNVEDYQKKYDYQIPLYYLACENAPELGKYKDKVEQLALYYIRPASKDGGCAIDAISADKIKLQKEKIITNLKTTVIDKIRATDEFEMTQNWNCAECAFSFLCDSGDDDND